MRIRYCRRCHQPVTDDGHGELVHEETGLYGCNPNEVDGGYDNDGWPHAT